GTTLGTVNLGDGGFNEIDPGGTVLFTSNTDVTIQRCINGPNPASCDLKFADLVTAPGVSGSTSNFPDHGDFYTPYILDPANPARIIIGTCRVWRGSSSNWGPSSFTNALSNKLNLNNSGASTACAASESAFVSALAAGGPVNASGSQAIYAGLTGAGASGGNIWVTNNTSSGQATCIDRTGGINPNH